MSKHLKTLHSLFEKLHNIKVDSSGYSLGKATILKVFNATNSYSTEDILARLTLIDSMYSTQMSRRYYGLEELAKVLLVRGILDWVAAVVFFLKGDGKNARAVIQARREFKRLRPEFKALREENLSKATVTSIPERASYSILWKFHAGRKKVYSSLP